MIYKRFFFIFLFSLCSYQCWADNIGLLIVATGKYIQFVQPLLDSARKHFCTNHTVTYFIFTDGKVTGDDIVRIEQKRLGWPRDTLMRWTIYNAHKEQFEHMDYLFALDADMVFEDTVADEILSDRVATLHPGYVGGPGIYERRNASTAYVSPQEGTRYFAGGFNGGTQKEFIKMARTMTEQIEADLNKNIIAVWHDESHVNRYYIDNPPTKILTPSYCYPQNDAHYKSRWPEAYTRRLVALDKDHKTFRQ